MKKIVKVFFATLLDTISLSLSNVLMAICNVCLWLNDSLGYGVELDCSPPVISEEPGLEVFEIYGDFYDIVRQIQFVYELESPNDALLLALKEWQQNRFISRIKGED